MQSLLLDVQTLQRCREEDKQEFLDFRSSVNTNFARIETNFCSIQTNFERLFAAKKGEALDASPTVNSSNLPVTPPNHHGLSANSVKQPPVQVKPIGTQVLHDGNGKELNLDGTPRIPYRHPNFGVVTTAIHVGHNRETTLSQQGQPEDLQDQEEQEDLAPIKGVPMQQRTRGGVQPVDCRRGSPAVKPAKMNIPEFEGQDADSWIQTIELYFDAARTPLEQRTEVAITYLKGDAIQWWRSTGYNPANVPWHRFCRYIGDRFAENSICDNVRTFYSLTQTSTVSTYIQKFEAAMNLMRRDNPGLPEDYYINSFISGLTDYIQAHLQCHKPEDMQKAMWLARRIEHAHPQRKVYTPQFPVKRQVNFEPAKPNATPASVIQQATIKNLCYKCKEPWFPGHKRVCKMAQKAQVQALQAISQDTAEIIYITEEEDVSEEEQETPTESVLQISMHAVMGINIPKHTFTLSVQIGNQVAIALVDSGSTATFMTPEFAAKANCKLTASPPLKVIVADGGLLYTEFTCHNCTYSIQNTEFISDFRVLKLKGYDIILGADWIYHHSPVELDYKRLTLKATTVTGQRVTFLDESLPNSPHIPTSTHLLKLLQDAVCGAVLMIKPVAPVHHPTTEFPVEIQQLLQQYKEIFEEPTVLPPKRACDHQIPLVPDAKPVNMRPYRLPHHQKNIMEEIIKDLLKAGTIRNSMSPYSSPAILIKKKDLTWRKCIDFRKLNLLTVKNKYPIPIIEDLLDELHGAKIFSKIDLRSGYHQIRMHEDDIAKTAFSTHQGHYEYVVMPFGLTNAPATFQQLMNSILAPVLRKFVLVFFDDILVYSKSLTEHVLHLKTVFDILKQNQLFAKMTKCSFAQPSVEYLGNIISGQGVATDPKKIQAIKDWPTPKNVTELRGVLGLTGYYRRYIRDYGLICRPLFQALKKDNFQWNTEQSQAFQTLKKVMTEAPVLALPDFSLPFTLEADACDYGIGVVLMQRGKPIAFLSQALGPKAAGLSTYDKEAMAILAALKQWKHYFAASSIVIKTDQQSLKYIQEQKLTEGIQHKLMVKLLGYNYVVEYKKGRKIRWQTPYQE